MLGFYLAALLPCEADEAEQQANTHSWAQSVGGGGGSSRGEGSGGGGGGGAGKYATQASAAAHTPPPPAPRIPPGAWTTFDWLAAVYETPIPPPPPPLPTPPVALAQPSQPPPPWSFLSRALHTPPPYSDAKVANRNSEGLAQRGQKTS